MRKLNNYQTLCPWGFSKQKGYWITTVSVIRDYKVSTSFQNIQNCFQINDQYLNTEMLYAIPTEHNNDCKLG